MYIHVQPPRHFFVLHLIYKFDYIAKYIDYLLYVAYNNAIKNVNLQNHSGWLVGSSQSFHFLVSRKLNGVLNRDGLGLSCLQLQSPFHVVLSIESRVGGRGTLLLLRDVRLHQNNLGWVKGQNNIWNLIWLTF